MQWSKDLESAGGVPNCTASTGCFSRLWAPTKYKFRLRSAKPLESQRSRSRFHWRNAPKQPTQNTAAKKRAGWEDVYFDYLLVTLAAHFHRNPPGRGQLAVFLRCSLLTYPFRYDRRSRLEKQPTDPAAAGRKACLFRGQDTSVQSSGSAATA